MSNLQSDEEIQRSPQNWASLRKRRQILVRLGIGCLAIFLLGFLAMAAVEKIQDMNDRAH